MYDNDTIRYRITSILDQRIEDKQRSKGNRITVDTKKELREKGECTSINALAIKASINPSDLYSALNGHRPWYPGWRKRISQALDVAEEEIFGEVE